MTAALFYADNKEKLKKYFYGFGDERPTPQTFSGSKAFLTVNIFLNTLLIISLIAVSAIVSVQRFRNLKSEMSPAVTDRISGHAKFLSER